MTRSMRFLLFRYIIPFWTTKIKFRMNIFVFLCNPVLAFIICLWTPSPQSNINCSFWRFMSTAGKLLSTVGTLPAVPKKITRILIMLHLTLFRIRLSLVSESCEHMRNGTPNAYSLTLRLFAQYLMSLAKLYKSVALRAAKSALN